MKKYFRIIFRATFRWTLDGLFLLFRLVLYLVGQLVQLPVYIVRGAGRVSPPQRDIWWECHQKPPRLHIHDDP
ncbi:MAG: hypothetical protein ACREX4_25520 [Gammaproteobacteria bacterium]